MDSFQSPEGCSTMLFPDQMGRRKAAEMLMLDHILTAEEAVQCGYVNSIIRDLPKGDNIAFEKIPAIKKLLDTDYKTLVNCKKLMN